MKLFQLLLISLLLASCSDRLNTDTDIYNSLVNDISSLRKDLNRKIDLLENKVDCYEDKERLGLLVKDYEFIFKKKVTHEVKPRVIYSFFSIPISRCYVVIYDDDSMSHYTEESLKELMSEKLLEQVKEKRK